jgi:hypothetical protein
MAGLISRYEYDIFISYRQKENKHDVNASLKENLKCLVFIPVISSTYCDPKSFEREYELKTFVEQATYDQFGLKGELPYGN